jgi:hypothetical protein
VFMRRRYHKTNRVWIWKAHDRANDRLIDWECGQRDEMLSVWSTWAALKPKRQSPRPSPCWTIRRGHIRDALNAVVGERGCVLHQSPMPHPLTTPSARPKPASPLPSVDRSVERRVDAVRWLRGPSAAECSQHREQYYLCYSAMALPYTMNNIRLSK